MPILRRGASGRDSCGLRSLFRLRELSPLTSACAPIIGLRLAMASCLAGISLADADDPDAVVEVQEAKHVKAVVQHPDRYTAGLAVVMSTIHCIEGGFERESDDRFERQTADADVPFVLHRIEGQNSVQIEHPIKSGCHAGRGRSSYRHPSDALRREHQANRPAWR